MNNITWKTIQSIRAGDEKAFAQFYHAYYVYLSSIAIYYIHDPRVASEIVNDVFINIWNKRSGLIFPIHFYLIKATQNRCISYFRSKESKYKMMEDHTEDFQNPYERFILSSPDPMQQMEFQEIMTELKKAVEQLPLKCRNIFKEHFLSGKSVEEIADAMNIRISTVRVQIKNSRDNIRELMKHSDFFIND